jgi:iron complex outermembrane recepter protein
MNPHSFLRSHLVAFGVFLAAIGSHQAADRVESRQTADSIVRGRVMNAATGDYLPGAIVSVVGTDITVTTDFGGNFRLPRVPAGQQQLRVEYTGLDPQTMPVSVEAGQPRDLGEIGLTSEVYQLQKVVVAGLREGTALAITQQRLSENVRNVVAADTFGNISDGNPGDLLQYMPGVSAEYVGNEVRTIQIRGMPPEAGSVTMDGTRMASSQSANLGREFEYETASLGNIETIELNKALLPDMEADAVSGSVNLRTKSPLDGSPERRIAFNIGITLDPENNVPGYSDRGMSGSLRYSEVFGKKRNLGAVFSSSYHKSDSPAIRVDSRYQTTTEEPAYTFQVTGPRPAPGPRRRTANHLKFEYQFTERLRADVRFGHNTMLETSHPREFIIQTSNSLAVVNPATGQITGGGVLPGFTALTTEARQIAATRALMSVQRFPKRGRTFILGSGGRYLLEDFELTWNGSYSYSDTRYHRTLTSANLPNIGWRVTRQHIGDVYPKYVQTAGPDMYNIANYSTWVYQRTDQQGFDDILALRADAKRRFNAPLPSYLKAGLNFRSQQRDIDRKFWDYAYTGTQSPSRFLDADWDYNRPLDGYRSPPFPGIDEATTAFNASPGDFTLNVANSLQQQFLNNKRIKEDVGAAYVMGSVTLGKLTAVGGVRVEQTKDDGEGPKRELTAEEAARRRAWGTAPVTPAEAERRIIAEFGGKQATKADYTDVFPSAHLKYTILPGFLARASWATGIGRPSFADIIPSQTINEEARTISSTNPGLKPQYSKNTEVSLEYYFEPVGVLSVGYFHKKITDFIFDDQLTVSTGSDNGFGGEYAGYTLSTTANGGFGTVKGWEINYAQQLSRLGIGFLSRFGVYANYTRNETEGNYDSGGDAVRSTSEIAGFIPRTANAGISYVYGRFDLRLQWNYRGKYLVAYSSNPAGLRFRHPRELINLRTKVRVYRNYSFYFDVLNLFNEAVDDEYIFTPSRQYIYRVNSPRYYAGVSGTF